MEASQPNHGCNSSIVLSAVNHRIPPAITKKFNQQHSRPQTPSSHLQSSSSQFTPRAQLLWESISPFFCTCHITFNCRTGITTTDVAKSMSSSAVSLSSPRAHALPQHITTLQSSSSSHALSHQTTPSIDQHQLVPKQSPAASISRSISELAVSCTTPPSRPPIRARRHRSISPNCRCN